MPDSEVTERKRGTGIACRAMDELLEFAQDRLRRLHLDNDLEGAQEMLPLLEGLAARLVIQRD